MSQKSVSQNIRMQNPRRIDAVIHEKEGPTKYWVCRNEHTIQKPDISV